MMALREYFWDNAAWTTGGAATSNHYLNLRVTMRGIIFFLCSLSIPFLNHSRR
jgi:hypothetical protein